jgi:GTP cyclohydrolase I
VCFFNAFIFYLSFNRGVIVVCEAQHFCMTARGVEKQTSKMITSAVRGIFKEDYKARDEFLKLTK